MSRLRVAIVGGSGYAGGELARLLLFHPQVELTQVASNSHAGQYLHSVHPNLRRLCSLRFCHPDDLTSCDLVFLCLPHGFSAREIERYRSLAPRIVDLAADFRLRSAALYQQWYGEAHCAAYLLQEAVYGLPEIHRAELPGATLVSGTGCMATAAILGLAPLYRAGLVDRAIPLVVEAKVGSSAAGATPGIGSHHPDRSGAVRSFQPTGHRHTAELIQELEQISGLVKERNGVYRYPEPKILAGSNYCDIGFELDADQRRVVVIAALDNLMKGAAGNAVQALNCMSGWDESLGLTFPGLHPV